MTIAWKYIVNISRAQIEAALIQLGVRLPDDFIEQVAKYNAGAPNPSCFTLETGEERVMSYLLSFDLQSKHNIAAVAKAMKSELSGLIPIADDPFGNYICYDVSDRINPRLVFWDHELNKVSFIARSFTELLALLK
jgi:SMI1-KNR4 cell-wall